MYRSWIASNDAKGKLTLLLIVESGTGAQNKIARAAT